MNKLKYICDFLDHNDSLYETQKVFLLAVLVLMDVIELTKGNKDGNKERETRRLPALYFGNHEEDIEHIFCQTPNSNDLVKFQNEDIDAFKAKLRTMTQNDTLKVRIEDFKGENLEAYEALLKQFPALHSLGNLLLLNRGVNRSYGNDEYIHKRERIINEYQYGKYIRPHTWAVFTKSFGGSEDLQAWGLGDIKNNADYIKETIQNFLKGVSHE